ncbi:CDP-glycerol glycerophosphotransferase family protein [Fictibacillus enclensis]|uniref:CDP-glycerol glycerophosphotransferase family protein n=1 Tax=Fictibacillus enclensis TaxID=1017270 RepID=UPI0025A25793|nr:CDP-glycerol glycerophosphotransferase family protein [Fictibacillus enclensis]MDM5200742.1 CDP-glycerol glycerophosphotransferase family protein [Fictibacillus enclensis]
MKNRTGILNRIIHLLRPRKKAVRRKTYKQHLIMIQTGEKVTMEGHLDSHVRVRELLFFSRNTGEMIKVAEIEPSSHFSFEFLVSDIGSIFPGEERMNFDLYLGIQRPAEEVTDDFQEEKEGQAVFYPRADGGQDICYPIRLGRFAEMDYKEFLPYQTEEGLSSYLYVTKKGNVSFVSRGMVNIKPKVQIDEMYFRKDKLSFNGKLFTRDARITNIQLLLKGRDTNVEKRFPAEVEKMHEETLLKFGMHRYKYGVNVDFEPLFNDPMYSQDIYDFFFELSFGFPHPPVLVRIGRPRFQVKYFLRDGYARAGESTYALAPYFTFKGFNFSLQVDEFEESTYRYLRKIKRWAWLLRPFYKKRNIWLVGERPYKAQDTGYHFFNYVRKQHPEKNVYYVIEKDSPELRNVEHLGNILYFKSKEHIFHTFMAQKVIGSHHPDYLYPLRTKQYKKAIKATKIFLQHGVMGTKNMVANYGKRAPGFDTDLFLVSSDFEKNMIVHDFGYDPDEVAITGLSRFDSLLAEDVEKKRQLLIIPTWRDWIITDEVFIESEYFERYRELINHPKLHELADSLNFDIVFCLHPNMQKFTPFFEGSPVRIISQGEVDVQRLLKESAMMITDYSSVGFDFSFLHKPILYYQFDQNRFIGKRPSHLDLENDLPGRIVLDAEEILTEVKKYAKNHFAAEEQYIRRSYKFLKYRDRHHNDRIYEAVWEFPANKHRIRSIQDDELIQAFLRRYRKSKYYFPSMRVFYKVAQRILPVDENLIVFESGVGKQYADSPRAIYEEILRRGLNYKKVWIYNKKGAFMDPDTKVVKRLSPSYYYYLAKAQYWVNNQNFPTYLGKRKQTTYIQTWHGTPLKKMLFDIEQVEGRDEGYVERVHKATKTWDYLISPSPYASQAFRSAFRYKGEMLEIGYPRNDIFYREDRSQLTDSIRQRLSIPEDKKVILYAPTFRDNQTSKNNKFTFELQFDFEQMQRELGDDYVLLLRMHVVVSNKVSIPEEYKSFVYNVSSYPDIQDLYLVTDVLITDYSSVMFDFANMKRPILFFTYDFEMYRDQLRGFYMDFEKEAPGPLLRTSDEVTQAIKNIERVKHDYSERYTAFHEKYCSLEDGGAAGRVVDRFFA